MYEPIDLVRARITCALEYLAKLRSALPDNLLTDSAVAIVGAQTALRQALRDLPGRSTAAGNQHQVSRLRTESALLDWARSSPPSDEPLYLDIPESDPVNDGSAAASTSSRF